MRLPTLNSTVRVSLREHRGIPTNAHVVAVYDDGTIDVTVALERTVVGPPRLERVCGLCPLTSSNSLRAPGVWWF